MGWRSTMYITKEDAIKVIVNHLFQANNDQLESMLMECQRYDLNNFSIVSSYDDNEDERRNYHEYNNNPFN